MKKKSLSFAVLTVLFVALLLLGGSAYVSNIRQSLWQQSVTDILEVTEQGGHAFEVYLEKDLELLDTFSYNISQYDSSDFDAISSKLALYGGDDTSFSVVDLENDWVFINDGHNDPVPQTEDEMAEYEAYDDRGVSEPTLSKTTGRSVMRYYLRFTFADGVEGMVCKSQLITNVSQEFSLSFYEDTGFSYIVNAAGDILVRPAHQNSNHTYSNIFDILSLEDNSPEDVSLFSDSMVAEHSGAMRLLFDGEEYIFAFVPLSITNGWYLISVIPDYSVMEHVNDVLNTSLIFTFLAGISLLLVAALFLTIRGYYKAIRARDEEIAYREQLFNILANNTNDVFLMLSTDSFSLEYVSPNVERVLGVPRQEVMDDLTVLSRRDEDGNPAVTADILRGVGADGSISFDSERVHRTTGERKWFTETVYRSAMDNYDRFIAVLSDRTAAHKSEQTLTEALNIAEAANAAKSAFLSNMSHDIRTPMNAIIGLSTLLQRDAHDPELVMEHTRKITASSQHLLGLINDVLDMSKIESGKTTLNIGEINLAQIVEELNTIMQPQARARQQSFEIFVYDIRNEVLLGDALRINQILINILSNAVKYTPVGGEIAMEIRQLPTLSSSFAHIRFAVRDNGIGMSPEYQKIIFQPFSREISSVTNTTQGTGLGMAITKNLVDLMGGTISVESEQGKGSTFTLDLELRIQEQEDGEDFWDKFGIHHMLLVDDDVDVCTGIMSVIAGGNVSAEFSLDGETAVKMVTSAQAGGSSFDLILLDWKMPGMDGVETARRIRQVVPSNVPIMILTAYDFGEIEADALAAGVNAFLAKPFFLSTFMQTVRNLRSKKTTDILPPETEKSILSGKHVLVAEDNELNAEILCEYLKMMGASSEVTVNGKEALERFEGSAPGTFAVILMDVQMPIMDGYEATRAIRACGHPEAGDIPIVAMTANAFADDIRDALESGMDAHIAKPVDIPHLEATLRGVWEKKNRPV